MFKKKSLSILIYIMASMQVLGYAYQAWNQGTSLANYLFLNTGMAESNTLLINKATIWLMGLAILWSFFKWSPWPYLSLGCLFLIESLFRSLNGGEFAGSMAPLAEAVRYLWLFAVGYTLLIQRSIDVQKALPLLPLLLRVGLALTFMTHGIEALLLHPHFIDMTLVAARALRLEFVSEQLAAYLLLFVGGVDLICAVSVMFRPNRVLLGYMSFWGFATAALRIVFNPQRGLFEALLRSAHGGVPLLIILLKDYHTSHKKTPGTNSQWLKRSRASS